MISIYRYDVSIDITSKHDIHHGASDNYVLFYYAKTPSNLNHRYAPFPPLTVTPCSRQTSHVVLGLATRFRLQDVLHGVACQPRAPFRHCGSSSTEQSLHTCPHMPPCPSVHSGANIMVYTTRIQLLMYCSILSTICMRHTNTSNPALEFPNHLPHTCTGCRACQKLLRHASHVRKLVDAI